MATQTRPTTPPALPLPLLVRRPFTTLPVQPLIPADAHRGRSPRTSVDPGRNISRYRILPRPTHPLASMLQLHYPPRGGTPLMQSPRRSLVVGKGGPSRFDRQLTLPPTPTSFVSSMSRDQSRSTSCHHLTTLSGAPPTGPGAFSVIRPGDWHAVSYAMLTGPTEPPLSPLVCREIVVNHSFTFFGLVVFLSSS